MSECRIQSDLIISGQELKRYETAYSIAVKKIGADRIVALAKEHGHIGSYSARDIIFFGSLIKMMFRERYYFHVNGIDYCDMYGCMWLVFDSALSSYRSGQGTTIQSYAMLAWRTQASTYAMKLRGGPFQMKPSNCKGMHSEISGILSMDTPVDSKIEDGLTMQDILPARDYSENGYRLLRDHLEGFSDSSDLTGEERKTIKESMKCYDEDSILKTSVASEVSHRIGRSTAYLRHVRAALRSKYGSWQKKHETMSGACTK